MSLLRLKKIATVAIAIVFSTGLSSNFLLAEDLNYAKLLTHIEDKVVVVAPAAGDSFEETADAMAGAWLGVLKSSPKISSDNMEGQRGAVLHDLRLINESTVNAWKAFEQGIVAPPAEVHFEKSRSDHVRAAYCMAIYALDNKANFSTTKFTIAELNSLGKIPTRILPEPLVPSVAAQLEKKPFSDEVFKTLVRLDVYKLDPLFENTCARVAAEIEKGLAEGDERQFDGPELANHIVKRVVTLLLDRPIGELAKRQWGVAIDEFLGRMEQLEAKGEFDRDDVGDWRHAFLEVQKGLTNSVREGTDLTNRLRQGQANQGFAAGSSAGGSSGFSAGSTAGGTSFAAVRHARIMGRIRRHHEWNYYRIQRINAR